VAHLTQLTHKGKIKWDEDATKSFNLLQNIFNIIPIVIHVNPLIPFFLEVDASNFTHGVVLFNMGGMNDCILLDSIQGSFQLLK
jgi:hypothetical protein